MKNKSIEIDNDDVIVMCMAGGCKFAPEDLDKLKRLKMGEVTSKQLIKEYKEKIEKLKIEKPYFFHNENN